MDRSNSLCRLRRVDRKVGAIGGICVPRRAVVQQVPAEQQAAAVRGAVEAAEARSVVLENRCRSELRSQEQAAVQEAFDRGKRAHLHEYALAVQEAVERERQEAGDELQEAVTCS